MNRFLRYISIGSLSLLVFACDKDEFTGDSTLTPTNPEISFALPAPPNFIEKDSTFEFTITINTPQIVDIAIPLSVTGGDATEGDDFTMDHEVIIPAHRTSTKASVKILADEVPEDTESFTVQIGGDRTANAQFTPQTVTFTIQNFTKGDLALNLSWDVSLTDASGAALDPTDVGDLILYVVKPDATLGVADGAAFEDFVIPGDWADGEYVVKAGVYAALDPGQLGDHPVFDLNLEYSQVGEVSATDVVFPQALIGLACDWTDVTLASIVKTGTSYTVTRIDEELEFNMLEAEGTYKVAQAGDPDYNVTFSLVDCYTIENSGFLGENYQVEYIIDRAAAPAEQVRIPLQELDGEELGLAEGTILTVEGSGTFDPETFGMVVNYDVKYKETGAVYESGVHTFSKP